MPIARQMGDPMSPSDVRYPQARLLQIKPREKEPSPDCAAEV